MKEFKKYEKVMTSCGLVTVVAYNETKGRILLDTGKQYIVGNNPQYDGATLVWQWGHYFIDNLAGAIEYLNGDEKKDWEIFAIENEDYPDGVELIEANPLVTYFEWGDDLQEYVEREMDDGDFDSTAQAINEALDAVLGTGNWRWVEHETIRVW